MPGRASGKILLTDSNVLFAKRLGDALKREGFEVHIEHSGLCAHYAGIECDSDSLRYEHAEMALESKDIRAEPKRGFAIHRAGDGKPARVDGGVQAAATTTSTPSAPRCLPLT